MPENRDERSFLEIAYEGLDKLPDYPSIERSIDTLIEMLDDTADLVADMTAKGPAAIGHFDGLVLAALIRSQSTIVGFLALVEQRNKLCAQPMIRFQLDSAMRLFACLIAKEPKELIEHIFKGGKPSKFKDDEGVPLNDYRLHTRLSEEYPEASRVYEDTSGYVHLSKNHLAGIWDANESRPGKLVFTRPDALPHWDELQVRATMVRFIWATSCILDLGFKWHNHQQDLPETGENPGDQVEGTRAPCSSGDTISDTEEISMQSPELAQVAMERIVELPYERLARPTIKNVLKPEFHLAGEVFSLAIGLYSEKVPMNPGPGVDDDVIVTVLSLLAKSCKQHRAIVLLVEHGIDEVASSSVRMLFETMAATTFLTRRRIILKENGKRIPAVPGKTLTTRFRSSLYRANDAFQHRRFHRGLSEQGRSDSISPEIRKQVEDACAGWEKDIGPVWTERIKRKGYAGVSIKDLSESLGMGRLYATMYRLHSAGVHGTDAANHSEFHEGFGWRFSVLPSTEGVALSLGFATLMLIAILGTVDKRLNLGIRQHIKDLSKKVAKMRYEFPKM